MQLQNIIFSRQPEKDSMESVDGNTVQDVHEKQKGTPDWFSKLCCRGGTVPDT